MIIKGDEVYEKTTKGPNSSKDLEDDEDDTRLSLSLLSWTDYFLVCWF
jgi:hypothetical protein